MGALAGILFGGLGVVTALAWWRRRARDRETLAAWAAKEEELADVEDVFHWEEHVEDPDAWKGEDAEDEEVER
jgi:hypothetical protein